MVPQSLTIATRSSPLARIQTEEAITQLHPLWPDLSFNVQPMTSPGDRDQQTALTDAAVPDNFFTRDLDEALLDGQADLAVHSAKDLPQQLHPDLHLAALLPARDIRDALVLRANWPDPATPPRVIGTSSPTRENQIRALYPGSETRGIRGTIEQRLAQLDNGQYDAVIVAACALDRLRLSDRISRYLPYDPAPQQGRLAIVVRANRTDLIDALACLDVRRRAGLVAIVGCPADAALLSERARHYMEQADVVIHDRLLPDDVIAAIHSKAIPAGKTGGGQSIGQSEIHRFMLAEAEQGKLVVRLQGGDPLIFAHLSEQLAFLTAWNLRVDLVPTLTAAQVAAAHALAPLTHRQDGGHLHIVSGHTPDGESPPAFPAPGAGNVAIYMGVEQIADTHRRLVEAGWPAATPVIVGERLGYRDEVVRYAQLAELPSQTVRRPAIFLLGSHQYATAHRTLMVGTDPEPFLAHGPLIHWPLIELVARPLDERRQQLEQGLDEIDGILFPSRFAVHCLMEAILADGDVRRLAGKYLLAVGPATERELKQYGLRADASVNHYGGIQALMAEAGAIRGKHILYPCSDAAPQAARMQTLAEAGLTARPCVFYENRATPPRPLPDTPFDRVLFTSGSTVDAYFDRYPEEKEAQRTWLAVGPSTANALTRHGLRSETIARPRGA